MNFDMSDMFAASDDNEYPERIAIIGMAGRFPRARNIDEFWTNICEGVEAISLYRDEELLANGVDPSELADPGYVKAGAPLEDADCFDASFFGYTPREAEAMDPQHRVFLECAWAALEDAALDPENYNGLIGVYGGVARNTYFGQTLGPRIELQKTLGAYATMISSDKEFSTSRVAYKLNLRGPAINIQTACSTSGVAFHVACQSLLNGDCDVALVGGARIRIPLREGYLYQEDGIPSPDGHCRAFDAQAQGTMIGNGVAIVVLKPLSEALRDGDAIHAVVLGSAINNDGAAKVGFTAPSVEGQAEVIEEALSAADVSAETIGYVETHGTGTKLGDPIEIAALTKAFRKSTQKAQYCPIGSLKTNVGHLDAGAAAASIIKTALVLKHGKIPPSLNFEVPNPQIGFENTPFFVNTELREWKKGDVPRRAGVSSFGLGGTNFHCILEEPPKIDKSSSAKPYELLLLSAKTEASLNLATENLAEFLAHHPNSNLGDAAYTLQIGRRAFRYRRALVCESPADAAKAFMQGDRRRVLSCESAPGRRNTVFMFPGGGAQYPQMGKGLYETEPAYRDTIDTCVRIVEEKFGIDLRPLLHGNDEVTEQVVARLEQPRIALAALFVTEYALACLWRAWGLKPDAMIGHSAGEYVAACIAGVVSLEDAIAIVVERGRLFETLESGSMLGVAISPEEAEEFLEDDVAFAAINLPSSCVLSGPARSIDAVESRLRDREIDFTRVRIAVAAHSPMLEPILDDFRSFLKREISFHPPKVPYISNVTGAWVSKEEATDPDYWVRHLRSTVKFSEGLSTLLRENQSVLLEVGPGQTLATLARQHPDQSPGNLVVTSLRHPKESTHDLSFLLNSVGRMWSAGHDFNWEKLHDAERRRRISLPTYSFERQRHWLQSESFSQPAMLQSTRSELASAEPASSAASSNTVKQTDRKSLILHKLKTCLHTLSGFPEESLDEYATFLELGFDSLFLTRANAAFSNEFKVKITFRQLFEEAPTLDSLAAYIDDQLPADAYAEEIANLDSKAAPEEIRVEVSRPEAAAGTESTIEGMLDLVRQQLQVTSRQLELLKGVAPTDLSKSLKADTAGNDASATPYRTGGPTGGSPNSISRSSAQSQSSFGPWKQITKESGTGLTDRQQQHLEDLTQRLTERTAGSKRLTAEHRSHFADPRAVAGFRRTWKELVYPVVAERSDGSRVWDVDGNEYIDIAMGFGVSLFGHSPAFILDAVKEQINQGIEIGPQSPAAGKIAKRLCLMTGMDRAAFCNTGSEAVLAALRVARTVTGRNRIVTFSGDYHGLFDEVLAKGIETGGARRSVPVAPGIPPWSVEGVTLLEYGNSDSLNIIREMSNDLAAVLVEPVQSRNPDLQPKQFLQDLRQLTEELGVALIFDEMITGFRSHPGGAQAHFGVRADIATYGKVIGGGFPVGIVAGKRIYLDALDGGAWSYGDDSFPEAGVTWFAGTFVRHPVTLAAIDATLGELEDKGPSLQETLNSKTKAMVAELNEYFSKIGAPIWIKTFSSFFLTSFKSHQEFASLFYLHLRDKGIHITEGRAAFLSTAHTDADISKIVQAFKESARELQEGGFLPQLQVAEHKPREELAPLTDGQLEIWLGAVVDDDANCAFNLSSSLDLKGSLINEALERAIHEVVDRFDSLRATITDDGRHMRIAPRLTLEVPLIDLSDEAPSTAEQRLAALQKEEVETPFDLVNGPLIRAKIVKLAEESHVLLLTSHHIIFDGWSQGVVLRELGNAYSAAAQGLTCGVSDPERFSDYAKRQVAAKQSEEFAESKAYWLDQLSGQLPVLDLPYDRPRPPLRTYKASREDLELDSDTVKELKRIAAKQGCTPYTAFLAAYQAFLFRLTGQSDLIVGIASAAESRGAAVDLVGHCTNVLPIRSQIDAGMSFNEFLTETRGLVFDAFENQSSSFGSLLDELAVKRDPSRAPLLSATFNLDPPPHPLSFHGLEASIANTPRRFEMFDFFLNVANLGTGYSAQCTFNEHLFDRSTIRRRLNEFQAFLDGVTEDPVRPIGTLPILPEEEQRLLSDWNATSLDYPLEMCLHEHFESQVARTPDAPAVVFEGKGLSYRELDRRANRLANYLRSLGVRPNDLVAICMERSLELVVALLGTLKSGGAYVPVDPDYPKERIDFMLEDVGGLVLTQSKIAKALGLEGSANRTICLDTDWGTIGTFADTAPERVNTSNDLAYVIYTSGSTGKPKGALNSHRGICNRLLWMQENYDLTTSDAVLQKTAISFDVSVGEFFWPLIAGAHLVLPKPGGHRDIQYLVELTHRENVSILNTVPSMLRLFLEEPGIRACTSLRDVFCGGEALSLELQEMFFDCLNARLHNQYGPSEAAISVTHWSCKRGENKRNTPIGKPIANTAIYILDPRMELVPIGQEGELYIGGAQVGLGYLKRPDLTEKSFVQVPFVSDPDARLYKTGDLARYLPDGNIEFLGRIDHQVKIRGYRIELGEIETVLSGHPAVAECVATVHEYGPSDRRILAYYRLKAEFNGPGVKDLREHIRQELPAHMVPSDFIKVEEFPLSPTGKIDRKKLPEPETTSSAETAAFVAPEGEYEQALATIWREFLSHDEVSATADFFELGGDSLTAFRMLAKVRTTFGIKPSVNYFLSEPTVRKLAYLIESGLVTEKQLKKTNFHQTVA